MKRIYTALLFLISIGFFNAQDWVQLKEDPNANFYQIQASFNQYWQDKDITEKGKGYKQFKRWENFVERRVAPSGDLSQLNLTAKNYEEFLQNNGSGSSNSGAPQGKFSQNNMIASTTWSAVGPMGPISGSAGGQLLKSGRINFIAVSPTNSNVLFAGAPAGGLWKSTNGGTSWTTNTDNFPVCGFSDLGFDATNTNIMYTVTGDGDAGDTRSNGVYKSIDGGNTWAITGLTFPITSAIQIRRLVVNPINPLIVMTAGNNGIYRTINGGTSWTQVSTTNSHDLEFNTANPNIVYASGASFRRSTDGGATWTTISSGITTGAGRMAIAVTPNDANYVYVLAAATSNGFLAFYRSTNGGVSFTSMATTPNLLGWASAGNDTGGQGWYDLCVACSPLDKNEVVTGGVNVWRTTNGGTNWALYGHWTGSGAPFTHADHHDLEYASNGTLFNTNDGTIYRRTATLWQEISGTMNISQIYKLGSSSLSANNWITGHQDNGTSTWNGTTYQARMGGDGMDCFIDRTNNSNMFAEYYNGTFQKSTNGGVNWSACTTGMSGGAPWVTIWKQDPVVATRLYAGRQNMFVSNNSAGNWTQIGTLPVTGNVVEFAIAPSNNQVIYVVKGNAVMKTTNGGTSWTNITTAPLTTGMSFANVAVSSTDANKVWVVSGNYSAGNKVFYSSNGGTTWTNFSSNLPNIPGNCLLYQPGSSDRVYVGMDIGVYYRDPSQPNWTLYNTGLPNAPLSDMEISPADPTKIYAATYGRGTWKVDVAPTAAAPVSAFAITGTVCTNVAKTFNDISSNAPTTWTWSSNPSIGVTITTPNSQNPQFTFANTGTYQISLTASNSIGQGNVYLQNVTVYATPTVAIASSVNTICSGSPVTFTASGANSYAWSCPTSSICTYFPTSTTTYTFVGTTTQGCSANGLKTITVAPSPAVFANASNNPVCKSQTLTLTGSGALSYTWNPGNLTGNSVVVSPSISTVYTVIGSSTTCNGTNSINVVVLNSPTVTAVASNSIVCAGTAATITANGATSYSWNTSANTPAIVVFPSTTTMYVVTGWVNGCPNTHSITLTVASCTGLDKLNGNTMVFNAYPNPFNEEINITANENVEVIIYNALGQVVKKETVKKKGSIATTDLANGVYILIMKGDSGMKTLRVVKN